jgi:acetyltransferase
MSRLAPLFAPRGIAVIGASRDGTKLGAVMARSLAAFPGTVIGVNARDVDPDAGRYASVADAVAAVGQPIDLAVLCVPAAVSAEALTQAAAGGVRAALVCSGGYAEAGGPGVGFQRDLVAAADDAGVALLGPNTSGFLAPGRGLTASFVPGAAAVEAGPVAVVAAGSTTRWPSCSPRRASASRWPSGWVTPSTSPRPTSSPTWPATSRPGRSRCTWSRSATARRWWPRSAR